jgi:hypothetical protein
MCTLSGIPCTFNYLCELYINMQFSAYIHKRVLHVIYFLDKSTVGTLLVAA